MKRDRSLDMVKGLACILMILAHAHGYGKTIDNGVTLFFYQIGLFAPILFFGSIGVSLTLQMKSRPFILIAAGYLLLFVVSFANMGLRLLYKDYFTFMDGNLYASLSLSALFILMIHKRISIIAICVPLLLYYFLSKTTLEVSMFYGGIFSFIPWIIFSMVGLYLHQRPHLIKTFSVGMLFLSIAIFVITKPASIGEYNTPLYIALGLFLYSFFKIIASHLLRIKYLSWLIMWLGKKSLLFYVIHRAIVIYFPLRLFAPLLWLSLFISTIVLMYLFIRINSLSVEKYANTYFFWATLVIALIVPFLLPMNIHSQRAIMLSVLLLHALNYHHFIYQNILKKAGV